MISRVSHIRRVAHGVFVTMLWLVAAIRPSFAQQQQGKIIGARLKTPQPFNFVRLPAEQKAAASATMQSLLDIIRRDSMFYEPVSFDIQPSPRIDVPPRPGFAPVEYDSPAFMFAYGPDTPATQPGWRSSTRAFYVNGNGLGHFFRATDKWQEDEKGPMYFEPTHLPDVKGFPMIGKGVLVVTKSERPLFLAAPLERTMRFVIEQNKKGVAVMKAPSQQQIVDRYKACITKLEQELAAMSPAERAGPTYYAMGRVPGRDQACDPFASPSDKNARRIIVENPDFYDTKRSPTAIQVVFVNFTGFSLMAPDHRAQVDRILDRLDLSALAALTIKP